MDGGRKRGGVINNGGTVVVYDTYSLFSSAGFVCFLPLKTVVE